MRYEMYLLFDLPVPNLKCQAQAGESLRHERFLYFPGQLSDGARYVWAGLLLCQCPQQWQPLSTAEGLNLEETSSYAKWGQSGIFPESKQKEQVFILDL